LNYGLWNLFGPLSWPIWALLLAMLAHWRGKSTLCTRFWMSGGLWGLMITGLPLGHLLIRPLENRYDTPVIAGPVAGIIMLTGAERLTLSADHGQPSVNEAAERLIMSRMLHQTYPEATLVIIGGVSEKGVSDLDVAGTILRGTGVAPSKLLLVGGTTDTCTNAKAAAAPMATGKTWLLVTSAAHMPRAMLCFRANGLRPLPYPVDYRGRKDIWTPLFSPGTMSNLTAFDLASHEWVGLVWYRIAGKTDALMP
jgi:uncharacterized SAM-binding protein YcdF (DUF218 family)